MYQSWEKWIGGKLEQFQSIDHMIGHWEDMERRGRMRGREEGILTVRGGGVGDPVTGYIL